MRIDVTYKDFRTKAESHQTLDLVDVYMKNEFGETCYGPGLVWVDVHFLANPSKTRKIKRNRKYKGSFAEHAYIETVEELSPPESLSVDNFKKALQVVKQQILQSEDLWTGPFDRDAFQKDFDAAIAGAPQEIDALQEMSRNRNELFERGMYKVRLGEDQQRRLNPRPLTTRFAGMRVYYQELKERRRLQGNLGPYPDTYSALLEGLLRMRRFMCPGYREIYFHFAETPEMARHVAEEWYENAYVVFRIEEYQSLPEEKRGKFIFDKMSDALAYLAEIDHLNAELLREVITAIDSHGTDFDLEYLTAENDNYSARLLYCVDFDNAQPAFRLEVRNEITEQMATRDLGRQDMLWLPYKFGKLEIMRNDVRIRARKSDRAEIALKGIMGDPSRVLTFPFDDLFKNAQD